MTSSEQPLTLMVKTPNQKVKDVTVNCNLDWSVNRLKQHLSQVYTAKPKITEQKLIYSGRLLKGTEILKDILKHTYEVGQTTHTVHLLCSGTDSSQSSSQPLVSRSSPVVPTNTDVTQSTSSEGLRHRHTTHTSHNVPHETHTSHNTPHETHTSQYQPYAHYYGNGAGLNHGVVEGATMPAMLPGMPYSPEQMMWFQQIYAQQMAQYMQQMQQGHVEANVAVTSGYEPVAHVQHQAAPPANGQVQNQQQVVMNAAGGQAMFDDDEEQHRDWLDVSYTLIRFTVLIMIVYFYSTLHRFLLVFGFFLFIWMYQSGWFKLARRNAGVQPNEPPQNEENARIIEVGLNEPPQQQEVLNEEQQQVPNDAQQQNENNEVQEQEPETDVRDTETAEGGTEVAEVPAPGLFRVAMSFFVTFWTSLLPAPPAAVNAN